MRISCILPVRDGERFLEEALDSVLAQGRTEMQIVVVDDGSTDGTPAILERYGDHVEVVRQEPTGVAAARNAGLRRARGELLAFQDADDLWMPGKMDRLEARFDARPELELCVGMIQNFWMDEVAEEAESFRGHRFSEPLPGFHLAAALIRASLFERTGPFDPSLRVGSDNDWFLRARDAGAIEETVPEVVARRRLHADNLTRKDLASRETLLRNMKASLDRRRGRTGG